MQDRDALTFERAARRIGRIMMVIAALGSLLALILGGWQWGLGFLAGSMISGLNYRWLRQLVETLGGKRTRGAVFLAFRYLILGGLGYVIVRYSPISLNAVLTGLFVLVAALFVEVIFEIVYGKRTLGNRHF